MISTVCFVVRDAQVRKLGVKRWSFWWFESEGGVRKPGSRKQAARKLQTNGVPRRRFGKKEKIRVFDMPILGVV
jgi:hypothetical protein